MDWNHIAALLHIVEKSNLHPKLASIGQLAMKELEGHAAEAKQSHDEIIKAEAKETTKKRQAELDQQAKATKEEQHKAHLTSQPQEVKPRPVAKPAADFIPEADETAPDTVTEPVGRRKVSEEVE